VVMVNFPRVVRGACTGMHKKTVLAVQLAV
jgi:hypothetical protein